MKMKHIALASALLAVFGFAFNGHAGEAGGFQKLDTDGDGMISEAEASAAPALQERWAEADTNGDGKLEMEEFSAFEMKQQGMEQK